MKLIAYFCLICIVNYNIRMEPKVSIIMGSTSDLPVMEGAAKILNDFRIPFEMNALSAHRILKRLKVCKKMLQPGG